MNSEKRKPLRTLDALAVIAVLLLFLSVVGQDFVQYLIDRDNEREDITVTFRITGMDVSDHESIKELLRQGKTEELTLHTADYTLGTVTEISERLENEVINGTFAAKGKQKDGTVLLYRYGELKAGETVLAYLGKKGYFLEIIAVSVVESHEISKNT